MWFKKAKMCDNCKYIETVKRIKTVQAYFTIFEDVQSLLASGNYEYDGGNNPTDTIRNWSQDGLWYQIKCKNCGTSFILWYDTFLNNGSFKKGR